MTDIPSLAERVRRVRQVNAQRLQRAVILMSEKQRIFFEQLPVLLHFNHPLLPGYIQDAPCGIEHFELSRYQQSYIDELCSATGYSGLADPGRRDIMSVYSMGSTGSIGQNSRSDLDIWVCHSHDMPKRDRFLLEQKCGIIANVAAGRGVEVNFFLVPDDKFTGPQEESSTLSSEDCGSAQRLLLLDEFYRSALHIAGRWLVWYLVPDEYDTIDRYDRCAADIMTELGSDGSDWFDLGTCNTISAEEFFGSALWLIYKGIHSPYKAVLKILLTEAYSAEFPETRLISQIVRRHCQLDSAYSNQMDPYYQTFMKVRGYLGARNDSKRMELAAGSFYLKMTDGLSPDGRTTADSFRRAEVEEFIRDGNISEATRRYVDGRSRWRISDVRLAYHVITETLMQSYRSLSDFVKKSGISSALSDQDLGILSRKLFASFNGAPHKVMRINLNMAPDISERVLTFVHVPAGHLCAAGWYVYGAEPRPVSMAGTAPLYYDVSIVNVLCWLTINRIISASTEIHIAGRKPRGIDPGIIRKLARNVSETVSAMEIMPSNAELMAPETFRMVGIFVNTDGSDDIPDDILSGDMNYAFSFGADRRNLVRNIEIAYVNSWGECYAQRFEGEGVLERVTAFILDHVRVSKGDTDGKLRFYCWSRFSRVVIDTLRNFLFKCLEMRRISRKEGMQTFVVSIGGENITVGIDDVRAVFRKVASLLDYYNFDHMTLRRIGSELSSQIPVAIRKCASSGITQYFFQVLPGGGFNIYEARGRDEISLYQDAGGSIDELVSFINRRAAEVNGRKAGGADGQVSFNMPQFYMLSADGGDAEVYAPSKQHGASSGSAPGASGETGGLRFDGPKLMFF